MGNSSVEQVSASDAVVYCVDTRLDFGDHPIGDLSRFELGLKLICADFADERIFVV